MTPQEKKLLTALTLMAVQHLTASSDPSGKSLDHGFISSDEACIDCLIEHGLVEPIGRGGKWTEAGLAFRHSVLFSS